jgi:hypothetical protein
VATPKQGIRIPPRRWAAAQERARARQTDASKVVNAALELYNAGVLDELLAPLLEPEAAQAAQEPSLPSGWARGQSPSVAIDST